MTTSIGALIASLYDNFEKDLHDDELAAVATEVTVNDLLAARRATRSRATRSRSSRRA